MEASVSYDTFYENLGSRTEIIEVYIAVHQCMQVKQFEDRFIRYSYPTQASWVYQLFNIEDVFRAAETFG